MTEAGGSRAAAAPGAILGRVMLAFIGDTLPHGVATRLREAPAAGLTIFRHHNVRTPDQVRVLTEAFQGAGAAHGTSPARPMLIAADQEGGQLIGLGAATTAFAGNLALGAADDTDLTERVALAIGREARSMGVNVVYAPSLDLATEPANVAIGTRSFGDDPAAVARHGRAFVRGLTRAGVAATVKHVPGIGAAAADTHHGSALIDVSRDVLDHRESMPFRAVFGDIDDDLPAVLAMIGHAAVPALDGRTDLPASLSRAVVTDLLRGTLGFRGVSISDALDMGAVAGGSDRTPDVVAAIEAGVDLLLTAADPDVRARIEHALRRAHAGGAIRPAEARAADARVDALRRWLGAQGPAPDLDVVGCAAHRSLEAELAARSITLVADPGGLVAPDAGTWRGARRVVAVMPRPTDLTPADTSSTIAPALAPALRPHLDPATEVIGIVIDGEPSDPEIAGVRSAIGAADLAVIGTIDAHLAGRGGQQRLLAAAAETGTPVIATALRGPWDVVEYPPSVTALATYSVHPASLRALAAVMAGERPATGRLPVAIVAQAGTAR